MSKTRRTLIPIVLIFTFLLQLAMPAAALADDATPPTDTPVEPTEAPATEAPILEETAPVDPALTPAPAAPAEELPLLQQIPAGTEVVVLDANGEGVSLASEEAALIIAASDPIWCADPWSPNNAARPVDSCTNSFLSLQLLVDWLKLNQPAADGTIWIMWGLDASTAPIVLDGTQLTTMSAYSLTLQGGWDPTSSTDAIISYSTLAVPLSIIGWQAPVALNDIDFDGSTNTLAGPMLTVDTSGDIDLDNVGISTNPVGGGAVLTSQDDINVVDAYFTWNHGTGLVATADDGVTIEDSGAYLNRGSGAVVDAGGEVEILHSGFSSNDLNGASINSDYSVYITNSDFEDNDGTGLLVTANGDILILPENYYDDSYESMPTYYSDYGANVFGNGANGAVLINTDSDAIIDVENSEFSGNTGTGLIAYSAGDIYIEDSAFNGMGMGLATSAEYSVLYPPLPEAPVQQSLGAYLDTSAGEGWIDVFYTYFTNNQDGGLSAHTGIGEIILVIAAEDNGYEYDNYYENSIPLESILRVNPIEPTVINPNAYGAYVTTTQGLVAVFDSYLSHNTGRGLWVESGGVPLVPRPYGEGGFYDGYVILDDSYFIGNGQEGAYIHYMAPCGSTGGINLELLGGYYLDNATYGVYAFIGPAGTVYVENPMGGGNGDGTAAFDFYYLNGVEYCPVTTPQEPIPAKPWKTVYAADAGGGGTMECDAYIGTIIILPNGDRVILTCTIEGDAVLKRSALDVLPGALPGGITYVSGMVLSVTKDGMARKVITDGGLITASFKVPEDSTATYSILYWDETLVGGAGAWVEMPAYAEDAAGNPVVTELHPDASPDDAMRIYAGVAQGGGFVQVTTNFPGIFVLVTK